MGQGSKNKTVFKVPVEITLVIGEVVRNVFPSSFYCSILIIALAKIPEHSGSI